MASTSASGSKGKDKVIDTFYDELAPSVSTPPLKPMKKPSYQVFINHRGPDVKATVATALYGMLTKGQLSVFLDEPELEYGDFFPQTLEAAMRSALAHIAIFSKRYAESPWCLAELAFILKTGVPVIPIFYHVDPNDLRWVEKRNGKYAQAFEDHKQKGRYSPQKLEEWKNALHKVSFYKGQIIGTEDDENMQLKDIVTTVLKTINLPLKVADHPVAMEELVEDINKISTTQSDKDVQGVKIVGILGMGGSGKTTLAKELYNRRSFSFGWSSFVYDVRDASTKGMLCELQKKILQDFCVQDLNFHNIEQGKETLSKHLRSVKVLIVLDDVNHVAQVDALLPAKDHLAEGSFIIITTRDYDVLKSCDITCIYKIKALEQFYAQQLLCWHAFKQPSPHDGFEELVKKLLEACYGLPLALKVIGAQLYGESRKEYWKSLLHKITRILPIDIQNILKISYDALDDEEKEMFLDAACFFIGEKYTLPVEIWNGLERSGLHTWKRLLNKCLVECDDYNYVRMHDHIRDLGRNIANKQPPYRFWLRQPDIIQNQEAFHSGGFSFLGFAASLFPCLMSVITAAFHNKIENRIAIQGIIATPHRVAWTDYMDRDTAEMVRGSGGVDSRVWCSNGELKVKTNRGIWPLSPSLVELKYLVVSGDSFIQVMCEVSRELVWLRWFDIGQRNLPSGLSLKRLSVLELYEYDSGHYYEDGEHHLEELWGDSDSEAPVLLRELIISCCSKFQGFPKSIRHLNHLKKIVIVSCNNITSLPDEFCFLRSLEHLVLEEGKMQSLPTNFGNLNNLRYLDFNSCRELTRLPVSFKNLTRLEYLDLSFCSELTFTAEDLDILENITKLEVFNLCWCEKVEKLPRHIGNNVYLRELNLRGTNLRELPDNIGQLSRLGQMTIENVLSTSLPSLGSLSSLTKLYIAECPNLESLPESLGGLSSLETLYIQNCPVLERVPDSLGDLSSLTNLEHHGVKCLAKSIRQLSNLQSVTIKRSSISGSSLSFESSNLKEIEVSGTEVCRISCSEDCCPQLERLHISKNCCLEEIEALPKTLESISFSDCEKLKNIPSLAQLTSLRVFVLSGCCKIEKIEGIENCTELAELSADTCWEVPGIESLERMQNLWKLKLRANKGAVIERCIQRIQKLPHEIDIFAQAVPDAASVVDSLRSRNVEIVDSIANQKIKSRPKLLKGSFSGETFMICLVINCRSSQMTVEICNKKHGYCVDTDPSYVRLYIGDQGRWVWLRVFTPRSHPAIRRSKKLYIGGVGECGEEEEVEKGLVVKGEEQAVLEALRSLLPLFQS